MSLINSAIKTVAKPYTSKGYRLLSKSLNIPVSQLKGEIPSGAKTVDVVEIASEFGKGHTTVTSFKDDEGKLVKRIIDKNGRNGNVNTVSEYEGVFSVQRTKSARTKVNGKLTQETFTKNVYTQNEGKLDREHLTINYSPNKTTNEVQYFESRAPHGVHNYVKTTASRNSVGEYTHTAIESNTLPQAELDKYAQTPYVFSKNYSKEDFLKAVAPYAKEKQNVSDLGIKVVNEKLPETFGGVSYGERPRVALDLEKYANNDDIVDTINHELRHQYQHKLVSKYSKYFILGGNKECDSVFTTLLKTLGLKKPTTITPEIAEEKRLAGIFRDNFKHHKDLPKTNAEIKKHPEAYEAYWNQPVEVDARNAGEKAKDEYKNILAILADRLGLSCKLNWSKGQIAMYEFITNAEKEGNVVKVGGLFS